MSTIKADTVQPKDFATDLTLGATGDTVTVAADSMSINKVQDKGGNTLWDFSSGSFVSSMKEFASQNLKLLSTQIASSHSSISFTTGIDSTYDVYIFRFIGIDADTLNAALEFQGSTDGGSNYNTTMTTTWYYVYHNEADNSAGAAYAAANDQGQGTAYQKIATSFGSDADQSAAVELHLFAPSSTTYVKHFYITTSQYSKAPEQATYYVAGYFNTTSALDALSFKMSSGLMSGTIKMYGLL